METTRIKDLKKSYLTAILVGVLTWAVTANITEFARTHLVATDTVCSDLEKGLQRTKLLGIFRETCQAARADIDTAGMKSIHPRAERFLSSLRELNAVARDLPGPMNFTSTYLVAREIGVLDALTTWHQERKALLGAPAEGRERSAGR